MEFGVHFAPFTFAAEEPKPSTVSLSVPDCEGRESEMLSKMAIPVSMVVILTEKLVPSEEVHPVPVDGLLTPNCGENPIQALHVPLLGIAKERPTRT